jgi:rubredoxin
MTEIKTWWKCSNCDYTFQAEAPPNACPSCKEKCTFTNVTCYRPDCGGDEQIDPKLAHS